MLTLVVIWQAFGMIGSAEHFELLRWESELRSDFSLTEDLCGDNEIIERKWAIQILLPLVSGSSYQLWKELGREA